MSGSSNLRVGVVGAGMMGVGHARCVSQAPGAELAGIADLDRDRAEKLAGELGAAVYRTHQELLDGANPDAVIVCTPDWAHREVGVAAAQAGKHVLVEKPLAMTVEDCDAIIAAAEEAGVSLMVGHILRFDPRYAAARAAIQSGDIGAVSYLYARRTNKLAQARRFEGKTTVLHYLGVHDVDWMLWAMGEPVAQVYAASGTTALDDIGVADAVFCVLRFSGGAVACVEAAWARSDGDPIDLDAYCEAVGTAGSVHVETPNAGVRIEGEQARRVDTTYGFPVLGQTGGALREEVTHFIECAQERRAPLVDGRQGRAAVAVIEAALESARSGHPVSLTG